MELKTDAVAPQIFCYGRIVDKRVAVLLRFIDSLIAGYLLFAHGVLPVPAHKQLYGVVGQRGIPFRLEHIYPVGHPCVVLVTGSHIHIHAGKIALVFVGRFKDRESAVPYGDLSHPRDAVVEGSLFANFTEDVVAFGQVGRGVGRHKVMQVVRRVVNKRRQLSPPALGDTMLDVHFRVRALGREVAHHIRIHVPDRAVGADVGGAKHPPRPRTAILNPPVAAYDVMQRIFQLLVLFAICCRIVAGRNLSPRGKCHGCKKQRACQADCLHGHRLF